jgi:hypothetical protein
MRLRRHVRTPAVLILEDEPWVWCPIATIEVAGYEVIEATKAHERPDVEGPARYPVADIHAGIDDGLKLAHAIVTPRSFGSRAEKKADPCPMS